MCKDFSCLVTQSRQVIWKRGVSSHDKLETLFKTEVPELNDRRYIKVEITPDKGYLYPEKEWTFKIDDDEPSWFTDEHKLAGMRALRQWKKDVYSLINIEKARNPINPLQSIHRATKKDIELLKEWISVWNSVGDSVGISVGDSVGDSVWNSVWNSVWDSVWNSVWAYMGSLFNLWNENYKVQSVVDLWKRGFVLSFDGTTWRLHSGKNAKIVYEMKGE